MFRSIGKQSGESVQSVLKKESKATAVVHPSISLPDFRSVIKPFAVLQNRKVLGRE